MTSSRNSIILIVTFLLINDTQIIHGGSLPLIINTWNFQAATVNAWDSLYNHNKSIIDSIVDGCSTCERLQCDGTVGFGGSPDENGETTLDAFLMDGKTMNIGAVGALREIKDAIAVARHVLLNTKHTMLVGSQATDFAVKMGFRRESLTTADSSVLWKMWNSQHCQPNFWIDVVPDSTKQCGPYEPHSINDIDNSPSARDYYKKFNYGSKNHDTIGMIVVDEKGNVAAGTSTNGAKSKIPGRVGDSPIPGAGGYADNTVGAAAATGDGDVMMRFLPSLLAVEFMRGTTVTPHEAGEMALGRIVPYYPDFVGAIVVARNDGSYGAACHGMEDFPYSIYTLEKGNVVERVKCFVL